MTFNHCVRQLSRKLRNVSNGFHGAAACCHTPAASVPAGIGGQQIHIEMISLAGTLQLSLAKVRQNDGGNCILSLVQESSCKMRIKAGYLLSLVRWLGVVRPAWKLIPGG
ncbi:hypothetical protein [Azotobacter salinestris]|uniref:hypothetical protein n=1 Tax=Azotobacter salinestris TaxID=69964 RepID=UPI0032DF36A6